MTLAEDGREKLKEKVKNTESPNHHQCAYRESDVHDRQLADYYNSVVNAGAPHVTSCPAMLRLKPVSNISQRAARATLWPWLEPLPPASLQSAQE